MYVITYSKVIMNIQHIFDFITELPQKQGPDINSRTCRTKMYPSLFAFMIYVTGKLVKTSLIMTFCETVIPSVIKSHMLSTTVLIWKHAFNVVKIAGNKDNFQYYRLAFANHIKSTTDNMEEINAIDWLIEHGFTSAPTQYRLYGRRFLQVWWPNQQCQSTEGGWLVIQTGLSLTRLTSPCYNNTTCMQILYKKII